MTKKSVADVSSELYSLLEPFNSDERLRIVKATLTLLGEDTSIKNAPDDDSGNSNDKDKTNRQTGNSTSATESQYFESKKSKSKIEDLAIAARFRELKASARSSTRDQLKDVFSEARINFDAKNFNRDIENARNAGFFNKGAKKEEGYTLSFYGQKFIDALPDREATKTLISPTRKKIKKNKPKKTG